MVVTSSAWASDGVAMFFATFMLLIMEKSCASVSFVD
jgi:hypothetical protein